jgi:hypothetical protein
MSKVNLDELRKSLEDLEFSPEEVESIIVKAQAEADDDDDKDDEGGDDEGSGDGKDTEELEKKKKKEEGIKKSTDVDILKAIKATNEIQLQRVTERLTSSFEKAIESITQKVEGELGDIKKSLDEIGNKPNPRRGFSRQSILEKGGLGEDEDGKTILSISAQKEGVIKAMEDVIEKSTDENRRGRFEKALLHYNMGGAAIPQDIAQELFLKENIRLVR